MDLEYFFNGNGSQFDPTSMGTRKITELPKKKEKSVLKKVNQDLKPGPLSRSKISVGANSSKDASPISVSSPVIPKSFPKVQTMLAAVAAPISAVKTEVHSVPNTPVGNLSESSSPSLNLPNTNTSPLITGANLVHRSITHAMPAQPTKQPLAVATPKPAPRPSIPVTSTPVPDAADRRFDPLKGLESTPAASLPGRRPSKEGVIPSQIEQHSLQQQQPKVGPVYPGATLRKVENPIRFPLSDEYSSPCPSPPKPAPPAPPGATISASGVGVSYGVGYNHQNNSIKPSDGDNKTPTTPTVPQPGGKMEIKMNNAQSWNSITATFQQFKKINELKNQKEVYLKKAEEQKQKQAKEKQRIEEEKKREREEEEAIEAARRRKIEDDQAEEERKKRERIEQMRRAAQMRREATANRIDMNAQNDLMASFEASYQNRA